jgi:hypothetical protein
MQSQPESSNFQIGRLSAGDIVFVYDKPSRLWHKIGLFFNVIGQRILAALRTEQRISPLVRMPKHSHVMLGLSGGLIIHADGKSVKIEIISDALHYGRDDASFFRVYRLRNMSPDLADKIEKAATRYYSQRYSFYSYFVASRSEPEQGASKNGDTTQFCSRLVAHAYRSAGAPLSELPDNRVLPLDLYEICQSKEWQDISSELVKEPISPEADDVIGPIDIPDERSMTLSEFFKHIDSVMHNSAELAMRFQEHKYASVKHRVYVEGLLAKLVSAQFNMAKAIRIAPDQLDDNFAQRISRVLQQLGPLLALAQLPTLNIASQESIVNKIDERQNTGLYVGLPSPIAILEMQKARFAITIYTYLLLAETGLFIILAHYTSYKKFQEFRAVKHEYARDFLASLHLSGDLSMYKNTASLFKWLDGEDDRAQWLRIANNIVGAVEAIKLLPKSNDQ